MDFKANEGKKLEICTSVGAFERYPVKTHFVQIGESYVELVNKYILPYYEEGDIITISEKIISLCQRRIVYKKDMKLSPLAKFLSKFASHSEAGIGVDSVWKMQFAIDHCGALKIIWAAVCAGIAKMFGKKGVFYDIAGPEVRGLDGFYDHSFKEYGRFGIMLPECPSAVCDEIYKETGVMAAVVDANDYVRDILGKCSMISYSYDEIAEMIKDNPLGQSTQMTPFVIIRKVEN